MFNLFKEKATKEEMEIYEFIINIPIKEWDFRIITPVISHSLNYHMGNDILSINYHPSFYNSINIEVNTSLNLFIERENELFAKYKKFIRTVENRAIKIALQNTKKRKLAVKNAALKGILEVLNETK
jgi:hypothetical protein